MPDVVEAIKLIGGLSGIASVLFLIYDRVVRSRPLAYLRTHEYQVQLVLKNEASESIVIDAIEITPPILNLARSNDMIGTIEAAANRMYPSLASEKSKQLFVLLTPLAERGFHFVPVPKEFEPAEDETEVRIRINWRNTRRPLPWKRTISVRTTVSDIKKLYEVARATR